MRDGNGLRCGRFGWLLLAIACGGGSSPVDGGHTEPCEVASDCDDGIFCNGEEFCDPTHPEANERGCVQGEACAAVCDEMMEVCGDDCPTPDADGDGRIAIDCGGDDCDDDDANRYPGNAEVCDTEDHDEDCDPATFGIRDNDGDGFPDALCCNVTDDGESMCGTDCDDTLAGVQPTEAESCDTLDNDCDGMVDEGVLRTFWTDADGDGRGDDAEGTEERVGCVPPEGFAEVRGDCDDSDPSVAMGLPELCNDGAVDEDCDGAVDEGSRVDCYPDGDDDGFAAAGASLAMVCSVPDRMEVGGCPMSYTDLEPAGTGATDCDDSQSSAFPGGTEVCNGADDDCDGTEDEGFDCVLGEASACTVSACGTSGFRTCLAGCTLDVCRAPEMCNYCDDDGDGLYGADEGATSTTNVDGSAANVSGWVAGGSNYTSSTTNDTASTLTLTPAIEVGYGTVTYEVQLTAQVAGGSVPDGGWSIFAYRGSERTGTVSSFGAPRFVTGWVAQWDFDGGGTDDLELRRLNPGGGTTAIRGPSGVSPRLDDGGPVSQTLRLTMRPDSPATSGADETRIEVYAGSSPGAATRQFVCDNQTADDCGWIITPGQAYRFGVGFANESATGLTFGQVGQSEITVTAPETCP